MAISTGKGDKGTTSLLTGETVWKDDLRVKAYGTVDEFITFLSETIHYIENAEIKNILSKIIKKCFRVNAELSSKSKPFSNPITGGDVEEIESLTKNYEKIVTLKGFVIRGSTLPSAKIDICCTILRRAERDIISLMKEENISKYLIIFINRLSDLLFILARYEEFLSNRILYYTTE